MKLLNINKAIIVLGFLCVGFAACSDDENTQPQEQTYEPGFTGPATRANVDGDGKPTHRDTYTIMAYSGTSDIISGTNQRGYYAYDLSGDFTDYLSNPIVPVSVKDVAPYEAALTFSNKLAKNLSNGLHLTSGTYYVSMIHPAVPVAYTNVGALGYLAKFNREDNVYASQPMDKDGNGTADDPFQINVIANSRPFDATGVIMHPVMSAIKVYLYSNRYSVSDLGHINPITDLNFTVDKVKLLNAGVNGWYNPRQDRVYPNYSYSAPNSYSYTNSASPNPDNDAISLTLVNKGGSATTFTDRYGNSATAKWELEDKVRVFPADYRGASGGGSVYVMPMALQLQLTVGDADPGDVSVPIAIVIERNKLYNFYINVTSEQITITYSILEWDELDEEYTVLGPNPPGYQPLTINWNPNTNDWDNGGGGSEQEIGGSN